MLGISKSGGTHPFYTGGSTLGDGINTRLSDPYAASVWVNAAVKLVVNQLTAVPLNFSIDARGGEMQVEDPALKAFWEKPAVTGKKQKMGFSSFIFATAAWYKLRGNAFWIMDDSWLVSSGSAKKNPLIIARPDSMYPMCTNDGELVGWRYNDGRGMIHELIPDQVIHFRAFNPTGDIMGLSEWELVRMAAESDYAAAKFSKTLMDNNGDRGAYVIAKDGMPDDAQREQIIRNIRQKKLRAQQGKYLPIFLTGDIEIQDPSIQAVDSAFIAQRLENRHEIFIGMGVPASFAEVRASYSIGSASDRYRLLEETCIPLGAIIADGIETVSEKFHGRMVYAEFMWDEHSTMQEVRAERFEQAIKGWDRGISWDVLNDWLKLNLPEFEGMNVGRVPFSMRAVGKQSKVNGNEPTEEDGEKSNRTSIAGELEELFKAKNKGLHSQGSSAEEKGERKKEKGSDDEAETKEDFERDEEEVALWESLQAKRKPWEKQFEKRFNRLLFSARAETLANIAQHYKPLEKADKSMQRKKLLELIFNLSPWMEKLLDELGQLSELAIYQAGGELASEELGLDEAPQLPSAAVQSALQQRENMLSQTATSIWHEIREELSEGIDKGESVDKLSSRIRVKFNGISNRRGKTIARTETGVAYESGRQLTMKEAGVTHKKWLTAGDERVRLTHYAANGQVVGIDEMFTVGNMEMMHPADPNAPAEEVINCRCVSIADLGE
eukprot:Seg11976.5 transcript_id=Seg11976.5/GoldUCD/mRNA.D3Y31 product="putative protein" protein_id=Seg11976.5/GoldUCD/D3Y31